MRNLWITIALILATIILLPYMIVMIIAVWFYQIKQQWINHYNDFKTV